MWEESSRGAGSRQYARRRFQFRLKSLAACVPLGRPALCCERRARSAAASGVTSALSLTVASPLQIGWSRRLTGGLLLDRRRRAQHSVFR